MSLKLFHIFGEMLRTIFLVGGSGSLIYYDMKEDEINARKSTTLFMKSKRTTSSPTTANNSSFSNFYTKQIADYDVLENTNEFMKKLVAKFMKSSPDDVENEDDVVLHRMKQFLAVNSRDIFMREANITSAIRVAVTPSPLPPPESTSLFDHSIHPLRYVLVSGPRGSGKSVLISSSILASSSSSSSAASEMGDGVLVVTCPAVSGRGGGGGGGWRQGETEGEGDGDLVQAFQEAMATAVGRKDLFAPNPVQWVVQQLKHVTHTSLSSFSFSSLSSSSSSSCSATSYGLLDASLESMWLGARDYRQQQQAVPVLVLEQAEALTGTEEGRALLLHMQRLARHWAVRETHTKSHRNTESTLPPTLFPLIPICIFIHLFIHLDWLHFTPLSDCIRHILLFQLL